MEHVTPATHTLDPMRTDGFAISSPMGCPAGKPQRDPVKSWCPGGPFAPEEHPPLVRSDTRLRITSPGEGDEEDSLSAVTSSPFPLGWRPTLTLLIQAQCALSLPLPSLSNSPSRRDLISSFQLRRQ